MNATIKSTFWSDVRLIELGKDHKHALLWLMTNSNRDLCGFTEVSPRHFTLETELPIEVLNEACAGSGGNFIALSGNVYFIRRFLRHQFGCGGVLSLGNKVIKAAVRRANSMPEELANEFFSAYPELVSERLATAPPHYAVIPASTPADAPSIPLPSSIEKNGCPNSSVIAEQEHRQCTRETPSSDLHDTGKGSDETTVTSVNPVSQGNEAPPLDPASIAALYPRRQAVREAVSHISRHIRDGACPQAIADGTRAIAAAIQQLPSGHLNAYVPSAAKFFENRRWEDDPRTWLRLAPGKGQRAGMNGEQPQQLSLGGRAATTIKIS